MEGFSPVLSQRICCSGLRRRTGTSEPSHVVLEDGDPRKVELCRTGEEPKLPLIEPLPGLQAWGYTQGKCYSLSNYLNNSSQFLCTNYATLCARRHFQGFWGQSLHNLGTLFIKMHIK